MKINKNIGIYYGLSSGILWCMHGILLGIILIEEHFRFLLFAPIILIFANDFISSIYIFFYLLKQQKIKLLKTAFNDRNTIIISFAALFGGPIGMSCYVMAIQHIGVSYTAAISASYPAFGAIIAFIFIKDKLHKIGVLGLLLSVSATMILGYKASTHLDFGITGFLFALACSISWGLEVVISSYGMKKSIFADVAYFIRQISSTIGYLILLIIFCPLKIITESHVWDIEILIQILFMSMIGTFSYLYYYRAISLIGPIRAMGLNITYAVWAILFGWLISINQINYQLIILCSTIMLGSFLTVSNSKNS